MKNCDKSVIIDQDDCDGMKYKRKLPAFGGINSEVKIETNKFKKSGNILNLLLILYNYGHLVLLLHFISAANIVDKTQEADAKRQNALAEKWKTLQNQKCTITNALKVRTLITILLW